MSLRRDFRADHDLLDRLRDPSNKTIMHTRTRKFQKWLSKWLSISLPYMNIHIDIQNCTTRTRVEYSFTRGGFILSHENIPARPVIPFFTPIEP
jgi:hypothetical protein